MKVHRYIFALVVTLTFCLTKTSAQNILTSSIEWNSSSTFTASIGVNTDEITRVVTSPSQITWYDNQDSVKQIFDIVSSEGSWNNVSNNGSISFKIKSGDSYGIAQFSKSGGSRMIRIQLVLDEEIPIYELTITDVNDLQ
jgi:hypothetical protein